MILVPRRPVVQEAAQGHPGGGCRRQPGILGQNQGKLRHAPQVAAGVGVAGLDHLGYKTGRAAHNLRAGMFSTHGCKNRPGRPVYV